MKADGSVIIDTKIVDGGMEKGFEQIKTKMNSVGVTAEKMGDKIKMSFSGDVSEPIRNAVEKVQDLQRQLEIATEGFQYATYSGDDKGAEKWAIRREGIYDRLKKAEKSLTKTVKAEAEKRAAAEEAAQKKEEAAEERARKKATKGLRSFGKRLASITAGALVFNVISKGLREVTEYFGKALKSNQQFAATSNKLKGALLTAFQPLYETLLPAILKGMEMLTKFAVQIGGFFASLTGKNAEQVKQNASALYDQATAIEKNGDAAKKASQQIGGFDELNVMQNNDSGTADFDFSDVDISGLEDFAALVEPFKTSLQGLSEIFSTSDFSGMTGGLTRLRTSFISLTNTINGIFRQVWDTLLKPLATWNIEENGPDTVNTLAAAFESIDAFLRPVSDGFTKLGEALAPVFQISRQVGLVVMSALRDSFEKISKVFQERGPEITDTLSDIGDIIKTVWVTVEPIMNLLLWLFQRVLTYIVDIVSAKVKRFIGRFSALIDFLKAVFTLDIGEVFEGISKLIESDLEYISDKLDAFFNFFGFEFDMEKIKTGFKNVINTVIGYLNTMISKVCDGINFVIGKLQSALTFDLPDWIPVFGGKEFSVNIPTVTAPQIPYLAKGAVIPPNAPFMAMLGDQRHGTNIEAPLSTIEEAVARVTGEQSERMVAALYTLIEIVEQKDLNVQIGDDEIGRANARYKQTRGVQVNSGAFANAY